MIKYVVAVNAKEAKDIANEAGWDTQAEANDYLEIVTATDPFCAKQYVVYRVDMGKEGQDGAKRS